MAALTFRRPVHTSMLRSYRISSQSLLRRTRCSAESDAFRDWLAVHGAKDPRSPGTKIWTTNTSIALMLLHAHTILPTTAITTTTNNNNPAPSSLPNRLNPPPHNDSLLR